MCIITVMLQAALWLEEQQSHKETHLESRQKILSCATNNMTVYPREDMVTAASAQQHPGKTGCKGRRQTSKESGKCAALSVHKCIVTQSYNLRIFRKRNH